MNNKGEKTLNEHGENCKVSACGERCAFALTNEAKRVEKIAQIWNLYLHKDQYKN